MRLGDKNYLLKTRLLFFCGFIFLLTGCINLSKRKSLPRNFDAVKIKEIYHCDCDIRALTVNSQHLIFAGSKGRFGYLNTADHSVDYVGQIELEGNHPEFRGIAHTGEDDFIVSAGYPGVIYKVNHFGQRKIVYQQDTPGTFFNAINFWNDQEGIIIGDPVEDCMDFLITRDGGETWNTTDCKTIDKTSKNEAAFAASNTNIVTQGESAWVLTGGRTSRVYSTTDKGKTWTTTPTPIRHDRPTSGGYSMDFYNAKTGIIIGGDYTRPEETHANKAITVNGGKTWKLVADQETPGYQSAVQFVPHSNGREVVSVGPSGVYYSKDGGESWTQFSTEAFHTIRFLNDFVAYAAGEGKIAQFIFQEELGDIN